MGIFKTADCLVVDVTPYVVGVSQAFKSVKYAGKVTKIDPKFVYSAVIGITGDMFNENDDFWPWKETLLAPPPGKTASTSLKHQYQTWIGKPNCRNHINTGPECHYGSVIDTWHTPDAKDVLMVLATDRTRNPKLVDGIEKGSINSVSMGCFPSGTPLMTDKGWTSIENVLPDARLISSDSSFTDVMSTQAIPYSGDLINLHIEGGTEVSATTEHPFLVYRKTDWKHRFDKTRGTGENAFGTWVEQEHPPVFVNAEDLLPGDRVLTPVGGPEIAVDDINENRCRILGYFLAEGSYNKYKGKKQAAVFSFGLDEKDTLAQETIDLVIEEFGVKPYVFIREDKHLCCVHVSSQDLIAWLVKYAGEYSYGKSMPAEILYLPLEQQRHIVGAWVAGDGHAHKVDNIFKDIGVCTVSRDLIQQMDYILDRLGMPHNRYARYNKKSLKLKESFELPKNSIGDNKRRISYHLVVPAYYAQDLAPYAHFENCDLRVVDVGRSGQGKWYKANKFEGYIARKIISITRTPYEGPVFNFETRDNSYVVNGLAVHNCSVRYTTCSVCGNIAVEERDYCPHIKYQKGHDILVNSGLNYYPNAKVASSSMNYPRVHVGEICYDITGVEMSWVDNPAFPGCINTGILARSKQASKLQTDKRGKTNEALRRKISIMLGKIADDEDPLIRETYRALSKAAKKVDLTADEVQAIRKTLGLLEH